MTDPRTHLSDDDTALAAEYVLGTLPLPDRLSAEARIKNDTEFANAVAEWEVHFAPLNDGYREITPPNLLPAIEGRLFGKPAAKPAFWTRLRLTTAGVLTLVVLLAFLFVPQPFFAPGPTLTATLAADAQPVAFDAVWEQGQLRLTQTGGSAAATGNDYELWLIEGQNAPVSLGLITTADIRLDVDRLAAGAVLAVSLEPAGGSSTGAPTGPVLVTGVVTSL